MTIPAWPSVLGPIQSQRESFSAKINRAPRITQFDDGPSGARAAGFFKEAMMSVVIQVSTENAETLRDFVQNTLVMGQARFTAPIALINGSIGQKTCRITSEVEIKSLGVDWTASFTLQVYGW